MKKLFFLICFLVSSLAFSASGKTNFGNGVFGTSVQNGGFYFVVLRGNDVDSENIFTIIPDSPEGYHLIGIETYLIMEGKDHIKRIFIFSNDESIKSFSLAGAIQTDH